MARADQDSAIDWEQRSELLFQVVPYVLAPLATGLMLLTSRAPLDRQLETAAIAAGALVWTLVNYTRPPGAWATNPIRPYLYVTGVLAFAYVLMEREPLFFIYAITGFIHAFLLQPAIFSFVGIAATSVLVNTIPAGGWPRSSSGWAGVLTLVAIQTLAIGSFAYMGNKMSEQSRVRQRTVLELEGALAENAALHEQLLTQAREAGALDERQRMAAEIHDTLSQGLIGIITQLEAAGEAGPVSTDHDRHLQTAAQLARESLAEARRSVHALGPQPLEGRTLPEALGAVVASWSTRHDVAAEVVTTGEPVTLHPEVEGTLLRAAQEALANVAKHADASRVGLTLSYMGDVVSLDVRDDGVGFDPDDGPPSTNGHPGDPADAGGGFGLVSMQQRIARVAGTLVVESEPGRGTAVSASVPAIPLVDPMTELPNGADRIRLLVVDDHPVVRDGLRGMLRGDPGFDVVGEAANGAEAVDLVRALDPDVVLMDLRMPGVDGVAAISRMRSLGLRARVLVLTTYDTDSDVLPAIEAGATGYLLKDAPRDELFRAVRSAAQGEAVLSPSVATRLLGQVREPTREPLSARELEVLRMVARGSTNREAAERLFVSEATVKTHLLHIYAKLGVNDRAAAVATGYERGLLLPGGQGQP